MVDHAAEVTEHEVNELYVVIADIFEEIYGFFEGNCLIRHGRSPFYI